METEFLIPQVGIRNTVVPEEGQTRICLDPWAKVFVRATGEICLCCNAGPVGSLKIDTLDDILNSERAQDYRRGLLTGNVMPECRTCPDRPSGEPERLVQIVQKYLSTGEMEVM